MPHMCGVSRCNETQVCALQFHIVLYLQIRHRLRAHADGALSIILIVSFPSEGRDGARQGQTKGIHAARTLRGAVRTIIVKQGRGVRLRHR